MNLGGVADYSPQQPFLNYMKTARDWIPQYAYGTVSSTIMYTWNTQEPLNISNNGFILTLKPTQAAGAMLLRDLELRYPSGDYVLLYEGEGNLTVFFDAKIKKIRKQRIELSVTPQTVRDNGVFIKINSLNSKNPIRNLRLVKLEEEYLYERKVWNDLFVDRLKRYSGLRFMDWQETNNNKITSWNDRPTSESFSQSQKGVAIEHIVDLSNVLGAYPWVCIPHLADNNYIENMAIYLKNNLRADLKIYLEFSNEVWNPLFDQGAWAIAEAKKLGIYASEFYSMKAVNAFKIFTKVFGEEIRRSRLVYVLSTQTVNTWITERILLYNQAYKEADALGITGYFDCGLTDRQTAPKVVLMTMDEMFKRCDDALPSTLDYIKKQVAMGAKYSLSPIYYEAGPGLLEQQTIESGYETAGVADKFIAMNRDPRMKDLYVKYLRGIRSVSEPMKYPIFHYASMGKPTKYGSWGVLEYMDQNVSQAPKFLALQQFMNEVIGTVYKKPGCMDPKALNYDPLAQETDNSCKFQPVVVSNLGAKINFSDVALSLPAGALDTEVAIEVKQSKIFDNKVVEGKVVKLGPPGTQFKQPVEVCVDLPLSLVSSLNSVLELMWSSDEITWQKSLNSTFDPKTGKVCGKLMHFTLVGAFKTDVPINSNPGSNGTKDANSSSTSNNTTPNVNETRNSTQFSYTPFLTLPIILFALFYFIAL